MKKVAVMYSGGVDSSLVADIAAKEADEIYLLTCISNCHFKGESKNEIMKRMSTRVNVLQERNPGKRFYHIILSSKQIQSYLWNHFAIRDLVSVGLWRNQPCACCSSATFFRIFVYCIENNIRQIYDGGNIMMSNYPYQGIYCGEPMGRFTESYGITKSSPIYWYENEDVMLLYQLNDFRENEYVQKNIIRNQSSNDLANKLGIVSGDMKYNFENKNKYQILCEQEIFVNYSMFLFFYKVYGYEKMQRLMARHLTMQLKAIKQVIDEYLGQRKHAQLFSENF